MRRRQILFTGFVARMEDAKLSTYEMFGKLARCAGCVRGNKKEWMGCFLDDI